jgi:hypothetical protein
MDIALVLGVEENEMATYKLRLEDPKGEVVIYVEFDAGLAWLHRDTSGLGTFIYREAEPWFRELNKSSAIF